MAISTVDHFKLLNRWPVLMDVSRFRFNQVAGSGVQVTPGQDPVFAYIQQERDMIARALHSAVEQAAPYLGFYPRPVWIVDEEIALESGKQWNYQYITAKHGYIQQFGTRATTVIEAGAVVAYSDTTDDGVDDLASVTVTTAVDVSEIQAFFRVADGADSAASDVYQIEPLTVTDNGDGTVTLTGHRALFVSPQLWSKPLTSTDYLTRNTADVQDGDDFVQAVDVYRVYANTTGACKAVAGVTETAVTPVLHDSKMGVFRIETLTTAPTRPNRVTVSYQAGLPLVNDHMHSVLELALVRFANTLVPYEPDDANTLFHTMFARDKKSVPGDLRSGVDFWSPPQFGLRMGAYEAWKVIWSMRIPQKSLAPMPDEIRLGRRIGTA